jgi:hypothetical protein
MKPRVAASPFDLGRFFGVVNVREMAFCLE